MMKKCFVIAVIFAVICFLLLGGGIVMNIMEELKLCVILGMSATGAAFLSILFGLNSWKDK